MADTDSTCSIDGCAKRVLAKGMCGSHYSNMSRYGYAIPKRDWSVEDTIDDIGWNYADSGCWEWRGDRNQLGYGRLTLARKGLDKARVHRLMFERHFGPIPEGLVVRHKCDNPPCANPRHLELGTRADNTQDMVARGRHGNTKKTHCIRGHDLNDPANVRISARGNGRTARVCRACKRMRQSR